MSDYKSVFRNVRTPRRVHGYYPPRAAMPEPMWLAFLGGAVTGCLIALAIWWAI